MNLFKFQENAIRTYNDLGDLLKNSLHMTSGMTSEFLKELTIARMKDDTVNIMEEFGDIQWFAVVYIFIYGYGLPEHLVLIEDSPTLSNEANVAIYIGELADIDKASLAYGRLGSDDRRRIAVYSLLYHMQVWAEQDLGIDPADCRAMVIAKLRKRFPVKFEVDLANNRDLVTERAALESGI